MTAEKFRADGAPLGSEQFYIARDLAECADVNKRIPLGVACTDARERAVVEEKLRSLYGGEQMARVFSGEGLIGEFPLSSLPEEWESLRIDGIPLTERKRFDFSDLREIMGRLRGEGGCEWDRAQDHGSIRINLIEEAYELVDAIDHADIPGMLEESGDVLMQAVFHTQIAKEGGEFGYEDMLTALCRKLLDRHTHIFGENHADNADQALLFWNEAKKKEKKYSSHTDAMDRVPKNLPALLYAEKVQKVAKRAGFDWGDYPPAAEKVREELSEFLTADKAHLTEEGGDLLFAAVNLLRLRKVEAETALKAANDKFFRRFAAVEDRVKVLGKEMTELSLDELDAIWDEIKTSEKEV